MTTHEQDIIKLKRTPLYEQHLELGARIVDFSGWEMPVQYTSILEEHEAVRTHAGLFDVSHMGEFKVEGAGALAFLQSLVPNDVTRLALHQALYTQLCRTDGNVIDDLLIYRLAEEQYMLVVNAGNIAKDLAWVKEHGKHLSDVTITDQSDYTALLALQGPEAQAILQSLTEVDLTSIRYYYCEAGLVDGINCLISRTGYTGEDGFELYCAPVDVVELWQKLLATGKAHGLLPAGLGARDTLRLEAALCLYGHELDEQTNPLEAGLGWTVKLKKAEQFLGREALQQVKGSGPQKQLVGIEMVERGVARGGYALYDNEQHVGIVTSGAPGPTVHKNIALGYVDPAHAVVGSTIQVDIRGKRLAARIVPLPFYKRQK
ncbi:MAG: glycine cleavage system aminomethyltransferase GcvT [Ktedonobacteraceae bacterium]